jgi:hypothetical protein
MISVPPNGEIIDDVEDLHRLLVAASVRTENVLNDLRSSGCGNVIVPLLRETLIEHRRYSLFANCQTLYTLQLSRSSSANVTSHFAGYPNIGRP